MTRFITQGYKWESGGPISPLTIFKALLEDLGKAHRFGANKSFQESLDRLEMFGEAHLKESKADLWEDYGMTRQMGIIADLLHANMGKIVSDDAIINAMYFDRPDGGPTSALDMIKIRVCHIRKKLEASQYAIETVWGRGYRMVMKPDANRMAA